MANLLDTAQITMDLYYQNYKTDEDFFALVHFVYLCGVAYSKLLEDEYKEARQLAKLEEGFTDIFLQDDWLVEQTLDMKKVPDQEGAYSAELSMPLFSFPYDPYSFGIQSVRPLGKTTCRHFVRTTEREAWMDCLLPPTSQAFFYHSAGKLIITNNNRCALDKVRVLMAPDITSATFGKTGGPVPGSKEDTIIRKALEILIKARDGVVVDMTNNSNPNKALQTEIGSMIKP